MDELIEGDDAGFFEAAHASSNLKTDAVVGFCLDVTAGVILDLLWCRVWLHTDALAVVEVFDVQAEAAGTLVCVGDSAVDVEL